MVIRGGVPGDVRGPGTITVRQTTYLEIVVDGGVNYRIHFKDKREFAIAPGAYSTLALETVHPLLIDHMQPWASLYTSAIASDVEAVAREMESAIAALCHGWRSLDDYANGSVRELLCGGYGLLLHGPVPVCETVAVILERHLVRHSILEGQVVRAPVGALLLGRSFVVAGAFSFERGPS